MILKITRWLLFIITIKVVTAWAVGQFYNDPRREVETRKKLCSAYHPNTVFIGTSRTLYGIDPAVFDSLNGKRTRSYNFGVLSLSVGQSIRLADEMVARNAGIETIYLELQALDYSTIALPPRQVIPEAFFRLKVMADCPNIKTSDKVRSFLDGLNTTLFQMLSVAPQILSIKRAFRPNDNPIEGKIDLLENGHQSVRSELAQANDQVMENKKATQRLLAATSSLTPNTYYISQINQLIARARTRGKNVLFFLPNGISPSEYLVLSQVAPFLPEQSLVQLPESDWSDLLFAPENLFDEHHLNQKGARIFTHFLQEEMRRRAE